MGMNLRGVENLQEVVRLDMSRHTEEQAEEYLMDGVVAIVGGHYSVIMGDIVRVDVEVDDDGYLAVYGHSVDGHQLYLDLRR